jgi:hypothetical protein
MNININNFPLYKILYDKVVTNQNKLSSQDINKFINFTKTCDDSQSEIIYTIIRIYELKNVKKSSSQIYNVPYKGIASKNENENENENDEEFLIDNNIKNYTFDFSIFPIILQKMLIQFVAINNRI